MALFSLTLAPLLTIFMWSPQPPTSDDNIPVVPRVAAVASAEAEISNVSSDWGRQPWVENELGFGSNPDVMGQGNPSVIVSAAGSELKLANLKSTIVLFYNGTGSATDFSFDEVLSVYDMAQTSRQAAHSSVEGLNKLIGDDKYSPQAYPHEYSQLAEPQRVQTHTSLNPDGIRVEEDYLLSVSASSTSDD